MNQTIKQVFLEGEYGFTIPIDLILSSERTLFMKSNNRILLSLRLVFHKLTTSILRKKVSQGNAKKVSADTIKLLTRTFLRRDFNQNKH